MIKNAHYFNEPGSDIYKVSSFILSCKFLMAPCVCVCVCVCVLQFASTLRKFIIGHCAELERKYHTVPKYGDTSYTTFIYHSLSHTHALSQATEGVSEETKCEW